MNPFKLTAGTPSTKPADAAKIGATRIYNGTSQQETLWSFLVRETPDIIVEARAGSGKSSSCREGMWRMLERHSTQRIKYAVYNKQNADEFRDDCPAIVDVGTCHSFGYQALRRAFGSSLDKNKTFLILDGFPGGKSLPKYIRRAVSLLVAQAKNQYVTATPSYAQLFDLLVHYDIVTYRKTDEVISLAKSVLKKAAETTEVVDFDDQLWLPAVHNLEFPACDVLFLDEVQDWNPTQHKLIPLISNGGRIVAVGDRHQAVYAWRGADANSIPNLTADLSAKGALAQLPLTITFRCPKSHVDLAQRYVPDLQAHETNGEGIIDRGYSIRRMLDEVQPGDRVICPLNAPVITAALQLITRRQRAFVRGRAIGNQLVGILRQCGEQPTTSRLAVEVDRWRGKELMRLSELEGVEEVIESVEDRHAGLQAVISCCDSPAQVEPLIDELFSEADKAGAVNLSTVHRCKGLEAETVWFIDRPLREPKQEWEVQQQRNLRYVATTRSKNRLVFVDH